LLEINRTGSRLTSAGGAGRLIAPTQTAADNADHIPARKPMAKWIIVDDDQHKAFFNHDMICMFRVKQNDDGSMANEIEVEFMGGSKTKLHGESAFHFWNAISSTFPD
jgi:hypothetical protein